MARSHPCSDSSSPQRHLCCICWEVIWRDERRLPPQRQEGNWLVSLIWAFLCECVLLLVVSVDFVLKDPRQKDKEKLTTKPDYKRELDVVPKPWNKSFVSAHALMGKSLFITNPTLNQVLNLWYKNFSQLRLINARALSTHSEVFELTIYHGLVVRQIDAAKTQLLRKLVTNVYRNVQITLYFFTQMVPWGTEHILSWQQAQAYSTGSAG